MAINLPHGPTKGAPLVGEGLQVHHFFDRAQALNLVVVHDGDQVIEMMLRGKQDRFPVGTLVAFTVAEQTEDAPGLGIPLACQRHARCHGQTVPQRASGYFDARHVFMGGMTSETRAILVESVQPIEGKEARFRQHCIVGGAAMALAENEAVAIGPVGLFGTEREGLAVEDGQELDHGEG